MRAKGQSSLIVQPARRACLRHRADADDHLRRPARPAADRRETAAAARPGPADGGHRGSGARAELSVQQSEQLVPARAVEPLRDRHAADHDPRELLLRRERRARRPARPVLAPANGATPARRPTCSTRSAAALSLLRRQPLVAVRSTVRRLRWRLSVQANPGHGRAAARWPIAPPTSRGSISRSSTMRRIRAYGGVDRKRPAGRPQSRLFRRAQPAAAAAAHFRIRERSRRRSGTFRTSSSRTSWRTSGGARRSAGATITNSG